MSQPESDKKSRFWILMLGCIGVVYGDIGTSPLYAFREAIHYVTKDNIVQPNDILGILSLIIWALIVIVTLKYVLFLLRMDNRGQGGILSLMTLAMKGKNRVGGFAFTLALAGAALFYGDAVITPAISVLSAVEGLNLVTPAFDNFIIPISIFILLGLFFFQKHGTGKMSVFFGPVTAIWFLLIGGSGLHWIIQNPAILHAINPAYAGFFIYQHGTVSMITLGAVFLAITGAEALYADLGHFGRKPIQTAWLVLVFPCLVLNYLGQGALVLTYPEAIENPFFLMYPEQFLMPVVIMATIATIIASQAVITGAFSMTQQAIQLRLLPRMDIRHTEEKHIGQIYIPEVNQLLLIGVLLLIFLFGSSSNLASAYGISVTGEMVITTMLIFLVITKVWNKSVWIGVLATAPLLIIEIIFLCSNMMKVADGGYVSLFLAFCLMLCMWIWVRGSRYLVGRARREAVSLSTFVKRLDDNPPAFIKGTAIFLTNDTYTVPAALMQNIKHNKILHEKNIIVTVNHLTVPKILDAQRLQIYEVSSLMTYITISFGFMETTDIPQALKLAEQQGIPIDLKECSYFLTRRSVFSDPKQGLSEWQDKIYIYLQKTAASATDYYCLPPDQVVEMGIMVAV